MPTAGIEPATSSLPWMRATYCAKSATTCVQSARGGSHDLSSVTIADSSSMLVIIVYHTSCRCARENLKIFRFSKGKRGLGAKTPFSVFWCRPKHKKDKKKAFRRFFLSFSYLFGVHDDNSQNFSVWCYFFCDGLVFIHTFVIFYGFPNYVRWQIIIMFV